MGCGRRGRSYPDITEGGAVSLINQMLRDLEKRRKKEAHRLPSGEVPAVPKDQDNSRSLLIIMFSGLTLIVMVWLALEFMEQQSKKHQPVLKLVSVGEQLPQDARPIGTSEPSQQPYEPQSVEQNLLTRTGSTDAVGAGKTTATIADVGIKLLNLRMLETATSTRLMLEFEQLPEYRWELSQDTGTQLKVRLAQTGQRQALKVPTSKGALLQQIRFLQDEHQLQVLVDTKDKFRLEVFELPADQFYGPRLLLELFPREQVITVDQATHSGSGAAAAVLPETNQKLDSPVKRVNKKSPTLTTTEQAEQGYQAALEMLGNNEKLAAEAMLIHVLSLQPEMLKARLQLIKVLQQAGLETEAEQQLLQGMELYPENSELRKNYARRLMITGQSGRAVDILQADPRPEIGTDLEYYALLAALQQEIGMHQEAMMNYRSLLQYRPQKALWWLGLAISLDQSGNAAGAKDAYRQTNSLPGLRADLRDYVDNRLQAL